MVGNLGGAVIGHVADEDVARRRGRPVELVVADTHADDAAQLGEAGEIGAGYREPHDHQPVGRGAIGVAEFGERGGVALYDVDIRAEDAALHLVWLLAGFGIEHGDRHGSFLSE